MKERDEEGSSEADEPNPEDPSETESENTWARRAPQQQLKTELIVHRVKSRKFLEFFREGRFVSKFENGRAFFQFRSSAH